MFLTSGGVESEATKTGQGLLGQVVLFVLYRQGSHGRQVVGWDRDSRISGLCFVALPSERHPDGSVLASLALLLACLQFSVCSVWGPGICKLTETVMWLMRPHWELERSTQYSSSPGPQSGPAA